MSWTTEALNRFIESQIFFPDRIIVHTPAVFDLDYEDVWFETDDHVRLHGWIVPSDPSIGFMLFCHGNAGNISHRVENLSLLNQIGLTVFIFDYRGYGNSEGKISEAGFYLDVEAAYQFALQQIQTLGQKLVLFGRSLGGIAAVHLAATRSCNGVILESTFTNLAALARIHFPLPVPGSLLKNRLNALDKIERITAPTIFFHGDQDDIVPIELGRQLYEASNAPKEFVTLLGAGHNNTYLVGGSNYFQKIRSFVTSL